jgi:Arc/MetJ-type ribon-helix-helix transcriptional regulator
MIQRGIHSSQSEIASIREALEELRAEFAKACMYTHIRSAIGDQVVEGSYFEREAFFNVVGSHPI